MFYETKTSHDISKMFKYFGFIFINVIILPIAQFSQLIDVVNMIYRNNFDDIKETFGLNMIDKSQLFVKYIMTCSLMSQAVALFDLNHAFYSWLYKCIRTEDKDIEKLKEEIKRARKAKHSAFDTIEKDEYHWEISFHIAFVQVVYTMTLLYSLISPIIIFFGALFFTIKYFVDKYNLVFVYPKLYDSKASLAPHIISLGYFSLFF